MSVNLLVVASRPFVWHGCVVCVSCVACIFVPRVSMLSLGHGSFVHHGGRAVLRWPLDLCVFVFVVLFGVNHLDYAAGQLS